MDGGWREKRGTQQSGRGKVSRYGRWGRRISRPRPQQVLDALAGGGCPRYQLVSRLGLRDVNVLQVVQSEGLLYVRYTSGGRIDCSVATDAIEPLAYSKTRPR